MGNMFWMVLGLCLMVASNSMLYVFFLEPLQSNDDDKCSSPLSLLSLESFLSSSTSKLNQAVTTNSSDKDDKNNNEWIGYDIVTVVHHHDLPVLMDFGLESWQNYFSIPNNTRIFVICNPESYQTITEIRFQAVKKNNQNSTIDWDSVVPIHESIFPFDLKAVGKHKWQNKFGWVFQQILKLYAYRVLTHYSQLQSQQKQLHHHHEQSTQSVMTFPTLQRRFVVIDSDTVAVRHHDFFVTRRRQGTETNVQPVYNLATRTSGAYQEDCWIAAPLFRALFPVERQQMEATQPNQPIVTEPFPEHNHQLFTSITHHQVMDGDIVNHLLDAIEKFNGDKPAWRVLAQLEINNVLLSGWELYMGWIMTHHRHEIVLKQIPYVNSGIPLTRNYLHRLKKERDVTYLSHHYEYQTSQQCCVNTDWLQHRPGDTVVSPKLKDTCDCCSLLGCGKKTKITCMMLGQKGCVQDTAGYIWFEESS